MYDHNEKINKTGICSSMGQASRNVILEKISLPIPGVFPDARGLSPKECCDLFDQHNFDNGPHQLIDHFPAIWTVKGEQS
jgi:hypothetical protein